MGLNGIMYVKEFAVYVVIAALILYFTGNTPKCYSFVIQFFHHVENLTPVFDFCSFLLTDVGTCAHVLNVQPNWSRVVENVRCVEHPQLR